MDLWAFIEETNRADDPDSLFLLFQQQLGALGFDRVCYSLMTDHPECGMSAGHAVARNYPEDWMKYYSAMGYEDVDPVRKAVMTARRPFTWDEMEVYRRHDTREKRVMNEATEAKLLDGMGVSIYGPRGEVVGVGFASSHGGVDLNPNVMSAVQMLTNQFHQRYMGMMRDRNGIPRRPVQLSAREKEVLLWSSRGKSNYVIGEILCISTHSVDTHFRKAFRKLEVNDRIMAIVKAIRLGLINP
ncbi:MAG: hypothetical protein CL610_18955 [Anaerolineaceae bacterium]|nr:hypothetical protein [Anaerolineaceae bacterium]